MARNSPNFATKFSRRGERQAARRRGRDDQGEHAFRERRAARLQRIGDAQQRQRRAVEIQRGDGDQPEQRAEQQRLAEPRYHRVRRRAHRGGELQFRIQRRGDRADQHGPRTADEGAQVGPPERGAHAHVARQIARVIRHIDRPRHLIRGGREELRKERHGGKVAPSELLHRQMRLRQHGRGEDQQRADHHISNPALRDDGSRRSRSPPATPTAARISAPSVLDRPRTAHAWFARRESG